MLGHICIYNNEVYPGIFPPISVVVTADHPEIGISQRDVSREAIVWPTAWEAEQSLWFFGHEAVEAFVIQTFGATAPRWIIETFAQLGAHRLAEKIDPRTLDFGREELESRGFVPFDDLKNWERPQFNVSKEQLKDFDKFDIAALHQAVREYNEGEHATVLELQRYATAWKFGLEVLPAGQSIGRAIQTLRRQLNEHLFGEFVKLTG